MVHYLALLFTLCLPLIMVGVDSQEVVPPPLTVGVEERSEVVTTWKYEREAEYPTSATVGKPIWRSNASGSRVHGQFGVTEASGWPAQPGEVNYAGIEVPAAAHLYLTIRYSKNSPSSVPISIYLDSEATPRTTYLPINLGNWNTFGDSPQLDLGVVDTGSHTIKFVTTGQQYGVADLDAFIVETVASQQWEYRREAEYPSATTVGKPIWRSNASGSRVHGQFGVKEASGWPAQAGEVRYAGIQMPAAQHLSLTIEFSKNSKSSIPVSIYLDGETAPRATFLPPNLGDWNVFSSSPPLDLGSVTAGEHTLRLHTDGQRYGVLDLDTFTLSN